MPRDQAEKTLEARFRVSGLMESTDRAIDAAESRGSRFRLGAGVPSRDHVEEAAGGEIPC